MKLVKICAFGFLLGWFIMDIGKDILNIHDPITIKKSSDSNWERSEKRMPDTTITRIVIVGRDTLYPTTTYLNIK